MGRHSRITPGRGGAKAPAPMPVRSKDRMRTLLWILAITTLLLIVQQYYRWRQGSVAPFHGWSSTTSETESMLPVQFDENGELDLGTMERMLDILYKRPQEMDGYEALDAEEGAYRFRKQTQGAHTDL